MDEVEEFVDGSCGGEVPDVDGTLAAALVASRATRREVGEYCARFYRGVRS